MAGILNGRVGGAVATVETTSTATVPVNESSESKVQQPEKSHEWRTIKSSKFSLPRQRQGWNLYTSAIRSRENTRDALE
jgi:hypothetical protein